MIRFIILLCQSITHLKNILILNILFKCNSDNSLKEKLRIIMTAVDVDAQNGLLHGEDDFLNGKLFYVFCVTAYAR